MKNIIALSLAFGLLTGITAASLTQPAMAKGKLIAQAEKKSEAGEKTEKKAKKHKAAKAEKSEKAEKKAEKTEPATK